MDLDYFKQFSSYKEELNNNKNVWSYTRVSSKEQFDNNSSIKNQKDAAEYFAENYNFNITNTFGGTYESAKGDFTRKEFSRLIDEIIKSKQKPYAVLIYKMSRFSRSGGKAIGLVDELINKHKVHLIEVSTNKDTTTPRGEMEIMESLQYARKENIERLEVTLPGMIAFVKNGNWLGPAPRGYDHYGSRVKNPNFICGKQRLEINDEGHLLKKAWQWKLQDIPDFEIRQKLDTLGFKVTKQTLSTMWRRPFYCGIQTNKLLAGKAVKGNWKPIVSIRDFKTINERFDCSNNSGYKQSKYPLGRPLQTHLYCGNCGTKMTGYVKKQTIHYYKCQNKKCTCKDLNANSSKKSLKEGLHNIFQDYIEQFRLDNKYVEVFKEQMKLTIAERNKDNITLEYSIETKLKSANTKLEQLEKKYIFENLDLGVYQKYKSEIENEIETLNNEKSKLGIQISNLNKKIDKCIEVTQNVSKYWASGSIDHQMKLQKLLFPSGIVIDPLKRQYRTSKVNSIFSAIASISRDKETKTKNSSSELNDESCLVAGTGLEPVTFGL
jgi:site-specific DNA recombinase